MQAVNDYLKSISNNENHIYEDFQNMILFDALIYNKDRHYGNFGLLIDSHTRQIKALNPIFDNGAGLFSYALDRETDNIHNLETYVQTQNLSYYEISYDSLLLEICTPKMTENIKQLYNFKFKRHELYNLNENRLNTIEKFITKRSVELASILKKCKHKTKNTK